MTQFGASPTFNSRVIIYDRNMFIIKVTGIFSIPFVTLFHFRISHSFVTFFQNAFSKLYSNAEALADILDEEMPELTKEDQKRKNQVSIKPT